MNAIKEQKEEEEEYKTDPYNSTIESHQFGNSFLFQSMSKTSKLNQSSLKNKRYDIININEGIYTIRFVLHSSHKTNGNKIFRCKQ